MTQDLRELMQTFFDAELTADTTRLHELLAGDFQSIGEQGYQLDKSEWIARLADFAYQSIEADDVDLRLYDHCAIFRYTQHSRATWRGQAMTLTTKASQVWVELPEGWRLAAVQFSALDRP